MTKEQLQTALENENARCQQYRRDLDEMAKNYKHQQDRLGLISAENESLRSDKKWLQSMHSGLVQTMLAMKGAH